MFRGAEGVLEPISSLNGSMRKMVSSQAGRDLDGVFCAVNKQLNGTDGCYELFRWVSARETIGGSYHFQEGGTRQLGSDGSSHCRWR